MTERLANDRWQIEMLRRSALRDYDPKEPLAFRLAEHEYDGWLGHTVTLQEKLPLIEFIRDFTDSIYKMGMSEVALISSRENDYLIAEHEAVVTGFIGDEPREMWPEFIRSQERFVEESSEDEIVEYVQPDIFYWHFPPRYTTHYRLAQNERKIGIESTDGSTFPFRSEQLLQAYILHCFDRQNNAMLQ